MAKNNELNIIMAASSLSGGEPQQGHTAVTEELGVNVFRYTVLAASWLLMICHVNNARVGKPSNRARTAELAGRHAVHSKALVAVKTPASSAWPAVQAPRMARHPAAKASAREYSANRRSKSRLVSRFSPKASRAARSSDAHNSRASCPTISVLITCRTLAMAAYCLRSVPT